MSGKDVEYFAEKTRKLIDKKTELTERQLKYMDGSHFMTKEQLNRFFDLFTSRQEEKALIYVKEIWRKKVDYEFLKTFKTIHWTSLNSINQMLSNIGDSSRRETCTQAYSSAPYISKFNNFGILIEGEITLAGNKDLMTNLWHRIDDFKSIRRKFSSRLSYFIITRNDATSGHEGVQEFIVKDWKPKAIIIDFDRISSKYDDPEKIKSIIVGLKKYDLPILNTKGKKVDEADILSNFRNKISDTFCSQLKSKYDNAPESGLKVALAVYNSKTKEVLMLKNSEGNTFKVVEGFRKTNPSGELEHPLITVVTKAKEEIGGIPRGSGMMVKPFVSKKEEIYVLNIKDYAKKLIEKKLNKKKIEFLWVDIKQIPKKFKSYLENI